ncbi:MAG: site-specific integrase [Saprospiraceae bacterium]
MEPDENLRGRIVPSYIIHKEKSWIRLECPNEPDLVATIKSIPGRQWSMTNRSWLIPDTERNRNRFGLAAICLLPKQFNKDQPYYAVHLDLLQKVRDKIKLKGYSHQTLKSYSNHIKRYFEAISKEMDPTSMQKEDIEKYLLKRQAANPSSESEVNSHINAIKFLYEQVLGFERMLFYLPRPVKPLQLPKVLGEHELERLFRSVQNLKHKTILLTAFSCGLRVSEVVRLKISDIDSDRMQVFIERSKGKKDRYVTLSPVLLDVLRKYMLHQKPRPTHYLFEGQEKGQPYSTRSAQAIFNRAVKTAGIHKEVTFHALRHSFATHLLEKGVDTKYIKELLGHFDIKTTERYLHVTRDKLVNIQSPLDHLDLGI